MVMESHDHHHHQELDSQIMTMSKGKRTKRQKLALTIAPARPSTSSSTSGGGDGIDNDYEYRGGNIVSVVSSDDYPNEEEDMANCLMLLAQGNTNTNINTKTKTNINNNSNFNEARAHKRSLHEMGIRNNCEITRLQSSSSSISSSLVPKGLNGNYQCKTCDRCFHSFQALGGHRASHKKFKNNNDDNDNERKQISHVVVREKKDRKGLVDDDNITFTTLSLRISDNNINNNYNNNNVASNAMMKACKVHECSICGAEFGSGQALGGHMRKHRMFTKSSSAMTGINVAPTILSIGTSTTTTTATTTSTISHLGSCLESENIGRKDVLNLDLNLPAEDDQDHRESKFSFASNEQILVFSTSSLVDCHY